MIFLLFLIFSASAFSEEQHIARDEVFITPTYGILTERDRRYGRRSMAETYGSSFKDNGSTAWQCFESKKIKISCVLMTNSESEGCVPQVLVNNGQRTDLYLYRNGYGKGYCKNQMFILRRILKAGRVCIAGEYVEDILENGKPFWQWQFARMKSSTGDYCNWAEDEWGCTSRW